MYVGSQHEPAAEDIGILKQQHHGIGRIHQNFIEASEEFGYRRLPQSPLT